MCIRDRGEAVDGKQAQAGGCVYDYVVVILQGGNLLLQDQLCLLYTSDAADDLLCVDLGGRRIIKKKKYSTHTNGRAYITTHTSA